MKKPKWKKGDIAIIKEGCSSAGMELQVLGQAVFHQQWWTPCVDLEDEDPTFYKASCLRKKP